MNIKLKYFILLSFVFAFSNNTFAVTQNIGCSGEIFGDTITTFFTSSTVTYNQVVTAGIVSSIAMSQIYSDCNDAQYGSSVEPRCGSYGSGPYGGLSIDSPVQLSQQGVRNFVPTSANNTINTSGWTNGDQQGQCSYQFSYTVISTECSDNQPNDSDGLNDEDDPQCHTDCNPNNPTSYVPNHNSETTPPNGTCPAVPTLNLNGRAAFLQVVKNFVAFITTKAFAGE